MAARTPVQIAREIESIQALVVAGSLSEAAGRAAIDQLTGELLETAAAPTKSVPPSTTVATLPPTWAGSQLGAGDDLPAIEPDESNDLDAAMVGAAAPPARAASSVQDGSRRSVEERLRAEREQIEALRKRPIPAGTPRAEQAPSHPPFAAGVTAPPSPAFAPRASEPRGLSRFTRTQVAFATFFGMFFAGSLLTASNAYDDRRPVRCLIRLLGFVVYVPIVLGLFAASDSWFPIVLVNAFFALLFSQIDHADPEPKRVEPAWKVGAAVAAGWIGWAFFVLPFADAAYQAVHEPYRATSTQRAPADTARSAPIPELDKLVGPAPEAPVPFDLDAPAKESGVKTSASPGKVPATSKSVVDVTQFLGCYRDDGVMLNWHEHIVTMAYDGGGAIMYVRRTSSAEATVKVRYAKQPLADGTATLRVSGGSVVVVQGGRTLWTLPLRSSEPQGCL